MKNNNSLTKDILSSFADMTPRDVFETIIDTSPRDLYDTVAITASVLKSTYNKLAETPNTTITIDMTGLTYLLAELEEQRQVAKLINRHTFTGETA